MLTTLDAEQLEYRRNNGKPTFIQSAQSGCFSLVPRIVSYLYNCQDELQACNYINYILLMMLSVA